MKSFILKDLYNIGHNAKSMLLILIVFAVFFIPSGVSGYIFVCSILCSSMIMTTFSFDDHSKWARYAMIMPVTRKDLVAGKFITLVIFCTMGSLFGLVVSAIGGGIIHKITFDPAGISELLFLTLLAWVFSLVLGGISIPLVIRYGAERGRMLMFVSFLIPTAICFGIYQLLILFGIAITDQLIFNLICCSPILALVWCYLMYQISCQIFSRQEL